MKRAQRRQQGRNAFDVIEEATHLLRTAPIATLTTYYLGAIPFVLGLLYFWADMSRSPLAPQHIAGASFGLALLFFWMKFCHSLFSRRARAQAAHEAFRAPGFRRGLRIFFMQGIIQSTGLFLLPLAALPILPFPWIYAFYQSANALDTGEDEGTAALMKKSWSQAKLWPKQNNSVVAILFIFTFCVFLNWITVCSALPELGKMLFGIESDFTKGHFALFNTTFFAAMFGLTYLCVDPILKTIYALRCFYGESLESGEDLKAEMAPFIQSTVKPVTAILILICTVQLVSGEGSRPGFPSARLAPNDNAFEVTEHLVNFERSSEPRGRGSLRPGRARSPLLLSRSDLVAFLWVTPVLAEVTPAPTSGQAVEAPDLDQAINETIHERKYIWRMPREKAIEQEKPHGVVGNFFSKIGDLISNWTDSVSQWLSKQWRKLFHRHPHASEPSSSSSGTGWITSLQVLLYVLAAAVIIALAIFIIRLIRNRGQQPVAATTGEAIAPVPDLTDENIRADQLPEDGWTKLARELLERGEFRLAMRAFYLAGLAHLAMRNLISIARFKSNREYECELRRRAHAIPNLPTLFGDTISNFERVWYGTHEATVDLAQQFAAGVDKLKASG
jgi:hypothetical protein